MPLNLNYNWKVSKKYGFKTISKRFQNDFKTISKRFQSESKAILTAEFYNRNLVQKIPIILSYLFASRNIDNPL